MQYDYALCKLNAPVFLDKYITLMINFNDDQEKISINGFSQAYKQKEHYKADLFSSQGVK